MLHSSELIERPAAELEHEPHIEPYWDPSLDPRSLGGKERLLDFLRRRVPLGMVIGVRRKKSCASLFFVKKKGGMIRMIVDGRQPSANHRLPPHTSLASVEAITSLRIGIVPLFPTLFPCVFVLQQQRSRSSGIRPQLVRITDLTLCIYICLMYNA